MLPAGPYAGSAPVPEVTPMTAPIETRGLLLDPPAVVRWPGVHEHLSAES